MWSARRAWIVVAALLVPGAAVEGAPPEGDVTLEARLVKESVKLGEDAVLALTLTNRSSDAITAPVLRLAGDSVSVSVSWQGTERPSVVTRLWGEFERADGQLVFRPKATRKRRVGMGKTLEATIRFAAVRAGDLQLTVELAADAVGKKALRAAPVVLAVQPPRASVRYPTLQVRTTDSAKAAFSVELDGEHAFNTASHVWMLARQGFYDGLPFHRIVSERLVQTGCPRGDGAGGAGFYLPAENQVKRFERAQVGMARGAHADSASSQWFVATAAGDEGYAAGFTLLGKVTKGIEVAETLAATELEPDSDRPVKAPLVKSVRLWGK